MVTGVNTSDIGDVIDTTLVSSGLTLTETSLTAATTTEITATNNYNHSFDHSYSHTLKVQYSIVIQCIFCIKISLYGSLAVHSVCALKRKPGVRTHPGSVNGKQSGSDQNQTTLL